MFDVSVECLQLVVTECLYLLDGYCLSFFPIDSEVDARSVEWYRRFFFLFNYVPQVVIFLRDPVSNVLVFVVLFVFYRHYRASVYSF